MNKDDLDGGASLAVERQAAGDTLFHRLFQIGIGQDDGWILRLKPQGHPQAMGPWMNLLQAVGGLARAASVSILPEAINGGVRDRPAP